MRFIYVSPYKGASIFELGNNYIYCILKSFWLHTDSFSIRRCDHISISNSHLHLTIWKILENRIRIIRCLQKFFQHNCHENWIEQKNKIHSTNLIRSTPLWNIPSPGVEDSFNHQHVRKGVTHCLINHIHEQQKALTISACLNIIIHKLTYFYYDNNM